MSWKGIYIKNHFWLLILCLENSLEVRSEASLTLHPLVGHHLSCPWVAMTSLHSVWLGFKLVVNSLREELSSACTRSGRNESSPLGEGG